VFAQFLSDAFYCVHEALRHLAARKIRLHLGNELLPECIADAIVNGVITHDGETARLGRHEKHDGVPMCVFVKARLHEVLARIFQRIRGFARNHANADASAGPAFRLVDGAADAIAVERLH
jgi:hypothetical protein